MEERVLTDTRGNIAIYPSRRKTRTAKIDRQSQPLNLEEEPKLTSLPASNYHLNIKQHNITTSEQMSSEHQAT
jgi:hypothetical protein